MSCLHLHTDADLHLAPPGDQKAGRTMHRIVGIFRRAKVSFFGERLDFVGFNSVFRITDKRRLFCLKEHVRPILLTTHYVIHCSIYTLRSLFLAGT